MFLGNNPSRADTLYIDDYQDLLAYFERVGFTPENWRNGNREVPNFTFIKVPESWRSRTVHEIDVKTKKLLFFRALAGPALKANGAVMAEREKMLSILNSDNQTSDDKAWLIDIALRYRVIKEKPDQLSAAQTTELKNRVDIIPLSLILAQSAEESGWGTSRFAAEGNSLFGQWTWGPNSMKPKQQRTELGDYGLAAYDTVLDAVKAYISNLNSHDAYAQVRAIRTKMRDAGEDVRGEPMADGLLRYSERGQKYIDGIKAIMRVNKLAETDFAHLAAGEEVLIVRTVE